MLCCEQLCNCVSLFYSSLVLPHCLLFFPLLSRFCFSFVCLHFSHVMCSCFSPSVSSFYFLPLCMCRIWWMISAKSSSWRWATWTEARSTEPESEGARRSGAAESPLLEHTGVDMDIRGFSYNSYYNIYAARNCWARPEAAFYLFTIYFCVIAENTGHTVLPINLMWETSSNVSYRNVNQ